MTKYEKYWGLVAGLLLGAGVFGHALRWVVLGFAQVGSRHYVAGAAICLYLVAAILVFLKNKIGLFLATIGPLMGVTAVALAPNAQIDTFQLVLGIPQFLAIALSVYLYIKDR